MEAGRRAWFLRLRGGGGLLLILSPRASRQVRRFVDRSLYASRFDYRHEWERVSNALVPSTLSVEVICRQVENMVSTTFGTARLAIYMRDGREGPMRRVYGAEAMPETIRADNPLLQEFERSRTPLVLRDVARDLDLIPVAVENRGAIQTLSAALCFPLAAGDRLAGMLWLSEKRSHEDYPFEDIEFLTTMTRHFAQVLILAREAEQLADRREVASIRRLSSYIMQQLESMSDGAARDPANLQASARRLLIGMRELAKDLSGDPQSLEVRPTSCVVRDLLNESLSAAGLNEGTQGALDVKVQCAVSDPVLLDRDLIRRALVCILENAREAIEGPGVIELSAQREGTGPEAWLVIEVHDSGPGLTAEFIRTSLFHPLSSTKPGRLGTSLARCQAIVEAHGGTISVASSRGNGSNFRISIPVAGPQARPAAPGAASPTEAAGGAVATSQERG